MTRRPPFGVPSLCLGVAVTGSLLSVAMPVHAQEINRNWEIEFHGGEGLVNNPTDGAASALPAGAPFVTIVGTTSRKTSSWYLGDGAALLNQVNAALGVTQRITPLDPVLARPLVDRRRGPSFGFRVIRAVSRRFRAELTFDYSRTRLALTPAALAGIEASRASFTPAWTALLATDAFLNPTVTSVSTIGNGEGSQTFTTGALDINLKTTGKVIPYVAVGAGFVAHTGETPSASLAGNYQFQIRGGFPVNETDTVTVRWSIDDKRFVGVVGGGLKYFVSSRWGIRFDLRTYLSGAATATSVETSPRVMTQMPAGGIASFTAPSLQFSNDPTLAPSSLSGPKSFTSFTGSGPQNHISLTAGVLLRF